MGKGYAGKILRVDLSTGAVRTDPTEESQVCRAITGMDVDKSGLYRIGERVFNLQRAILIQEGHKGRELV